MKMTDAMLKKHVEKALIDANFAVRLLENALEKLSGKLTMFATPVNELVWIAEGDLLDAVTHLREPLAHFGKVPSTITYDNDRRSDAP
jgi:hypothetical protein